MKIKLASVGTLTAKNTVFSPNFLVWKFDKKAPLLQIFGRFARTSEETVRFLHIKGFFILNKSFHCSLVSEVISNARV